MNADPSKTIMVWAFDDAPRELQDLSTNGGDEDWVALVPTGYPVPDWMRDGSPFAICCADRFTLPDGSTVVIGCHA